MTKFNSRSERRAYERKLAKARKKKALTALAMAGTVGITQFAGVGAAAANTGSSHSASQYVDAGSPVIDSITLEHGTLMVNVLTEAGLAPYEMTLTAEEDHSSYAAVREAHDDAKRNYEALMSVDAEITQEYEKWSDINYTFDSVGQNVVVTLKNGETVDFPSVNEVLAYQAEITEDYATHLRDVSSARTAYSLAQQAYARWVPSTSKTDYMLQITAPEGLSGDFELANDTFNIPGADVTVAVNSDGLFIAYISFEEETEIGASRLVSTLKGVEVPEVPVEENTDTVLPESNVNVVMPLFGKPAAADLVSGLDFADGATFGSLVLSANTEDGYEDFQNGITTLDLDYSVDGSIITIEAGEYFTAPETRTFKYRVTDSLGKTYTGLVTFTVSPAGPTQGLAPIGYNPSDPRTAYKDATRSMGIFLGATGENGNAFNFTHGQLVAADGAYATRDAAFGYQGERIAIRPTANDIAGPRSTDSTHADSYDPNGQQTVFAYNTLQVKDPITGLWTSTSYEGKNGKVSVLPAEGTSNEVLGAPNPYAEAVVAFSPNDRSALVSEQTEYRIGLVEYGETVDAEAFWATAGEGDFVSSTVTFGIMERDVSYTSANPYCYTPENLPDSLTKREHGSFLNRSDFRSHGGAGVGTTLDRFCEPQGVQDRAETSAGKATVIDVLANDKHVSRADGFEMEETNYIWDASSLRIVDADGNAVMELETENGIWEVIDGKLSFTAKEDITGTKTEEVTYTAKQVWVGDPNADYAPYIEFMTKREGGSISGIAATVLISGEEAPEVPAEPTPEPAPEPETPVEVPEVPEVPAEPAPEPETPVEVPEGPAVPVEVPEAPEVPAEPAPEPEAPVEVPDAPTTSDVASGETPTISGMSPAEFLALFALGGGGVVALTVHRLRTAK